MFLLMIRMSSITAFFNLLAIIDARYTADHMVWNSCVIATSFTLRRCFGSGDVRLLVKQDSILQAGSPSCIISPR